jgi:phi13 family phage major tail protein
MKMPLIGLKNIHVVKLTKDDSTGVTYDAEIRKLPLGVQIDVKPSVSTENFSADDQIAETVTQIGDIPVDMEIGHLTTADLAFLLGANVNSDGVLEHSINDQAPYVALGYEAAKSNGAVRYIWLYKGKFILPESSNKTKTDKIEFQTEKISATFIARINDGKWKGQVDSDDEGIGANVIANWHTAVYTKPVV